MCRRTLEVVSANAYMSDLNVSWVQLVFLCGLALSRYNPDLQDVCVDEYVYVSTHVYLVYGEPLYE